MMTRVLLVLLLALPAASSANDPAAAQQVLEQRCMVCHGCYDAPCQLKLEAHEGLVRAPPSPIHLYS